MNKFQYLCTMIVATVAGYYLAQESYWNLVLLLGCVGFDMYIWDNK